jgi:hypothetical protein
MSSVAANEAVCTAHWAGGTVVKARAAATIVANATAVSYAVTATISVTTAIAVAATIAVAITATTPITVVPGTGSDEDAAYEPARTVVAVGRASVRVVVVVAP